MVDHIIGSNDDVKIVPYANNFQGLLHRFTMSSGAHGHWQFSIVFLNQCRDRVNWCYPMLNSVELLKFYLHDVFSSNNSCLPVKSYYLLSNLPSGSPGMCLKKCSIHYYPEPGACLLPGLVMPWHSIRKCTVEIENESFDSGGNVVIRHQATGNWQ